MVIKKENRIYFDIRIDGEKQNKFIEIMKKRLTELDNDNSRKE